MRLQRILLVFVIILIIISLIFIVPRFTNEGNVLIATNYVKNEATYKFDGIPESFRLIETKELECLYCWEITFEYRSRHSGYGGRQDTTLIPVVTDHTARIITEKGSIRSAIMDDIWDMNKQEMIDEPVETVSTQHPERRRK